MRWRKGRKTPLDLQTNLKTKKADPEARIEKEKNISLSGTKKKKFSMSERETDQQAERNKMNSKIEEAEQRAKQERIEAAYKAQQALLEAAKKRTSKKKKSESKVEAAIQSTSKKKTTSATITRTHSTGYMKVHY